jgi:L-asparaginase
VKPTVALISTGGTISALGRDRLDLASYIERGATVPPGNLLEAIPEVADVAAVREIEYPRVVSHALTSADWIRLITTLRELLADDELAGVVVTHGTNTLEETAYLLSLTLPDVKPVVIVGAMRPASGISPDGPLNLLNAIRVATAPGSVGRGALVLMNDTIFAPRDVTKSLTYRVGAFHSPDAGPLGYADADGTVVYYHHALRRPQKLPAFALRDGELPRVDVVVSYVGADATFIDAAVAAGAAGIVSAGTGAGRPTPAEHDALVRASTQGVVICQSSRVGGGRVVRSQTLSDAGFVAADNLGPWKARVLLSLALTEMSDPVAIQEIFDRC